jgi:hypothetical protein
MKYAADEAFFAALQGLQESAAVYGCKGLDVGPHREEELAMVWFEAPLEM